MDSPNKEPLFCEPFSQLSANFSNRTHRLRNLISPCGILSAFKRNRKLSLYAVA
ncbi:hypothetical protein K439DRAFT_1629221, partial [Ramaria rubella]